MMQLICFIFINRFKRNMQTKFNDPANKNKQQKHFSFNDEDKFPQPKSILRSHIIQLHQQVDTHRPSLQSQIISDIKSDLKYNNSNTNSSIWGNLKPCWFSSNSKIPRIVISSSFLKSLLLNLLIITIVCILIPLTISKLISNSRSFQPSYQRLLQQFGRYLIGQQFISGQQITSKPHQINMRTIILYTYSGIWSVYQTIFLMILLLSNPGYGDFFIKGQASQPTWGQNIASSKKNVLRQKSKCSICKSFVDDKIYHCSVCDLCCQGFSHHCGWVGKCIGYRNIIFLKGYFYGYVFGIFSLILVIMLQSLKYE